MPSSALTNLIACPRCKGALHWDAGVISCSACRQRYPQPTADYVDLLPEDSFAADGPEWEKRQQLCTGWYEDLGRDPRRAVAALHHDYAPHTSVLEQLTGTVLDVGGGNGFAQRYLTRVAHYILLEPSTAWLSANWGIAEEESRAVSRDFVRGVGELLPFRSSTFDAAIAFWSLNHVTRPATVLREIARVVQPGAPLVVVLEDMEPNWSDLPRLDVGLGHRSRLLRDKMSRALLGRPWPAQPDHVTMSEDDLTRWMSGIFTVQARGWCGPYLRYILRRV